MEWYVKPINVKPIRRKANTINVKPIRKANKNITKNRLYRRFLRNPTESNELDYKTFRNRLTATIRKAKKDHYARKLDSRKNDL